jgi:hypothetical protein
MTPEAIVQQQLDAYNAEDIETLMATYAENAEQYDHPAKLLASNAAQIRERFVARFKEPNLHAKLLKRIVAGDTVIDHELVTRNFPDGIGTSELVAIYQVRKNKIATASFIIGAKTLAAK